jgi:hypothetical protein
MYLRIYLRELLTDAARLPIHESLFPRHSASRASRHIRGTRRRQRSAGLHNRPPVSRLLD